MTVKSKIERFFGLRLNERGQEVPDRTPVSLPVGYKHPPTLEDRMREMIRYSLSHAAAQAGGETFEEANDFDVGDEDADPLTGQRFLDEEVTVNDPFVDKAFHEEVPKVKERLESVKKAKQAKDKLDHSKDSNRSVEPKPEALEGDLED